MSLRIAKYPLGAPPYALWAVRPLRGEEDADGLRPGFLDALDTTVRKLAKIENDYIYEKGPVGRLYIEKCKKQRRLLTKKICGHLDTLSRAPWHFYSASDAWTRLCTDAEAWKKPSGPGSLKTLAEEAAALDAELGLEITVVPCEPDEEMPETMESPPAALPTPPPTQPTISIVNIPNLSTGPSRQAGPLQSSIRRRRRISGDGNISKPKRVRIDTGPLGRVPRLHEATTRTLCAGGAALNDGAICVISEDPARSEASKLTYHPGAFVFVAKPDKCKDGFPWIARIIGFESHSFCDIDAEIEWYNPRDGKDLQIGKSPATFPARSTMAPLTSSDLLNLPLFQIPQPSIAAEESDAFSMSLLGSVKSTDPASFTKSSRRVEKEAAEMDGKVKSSNKVEQSDPISVKTSNGLSTAQDAPHIAYRRALKRKGRKPSDNSVTMHTSTSTSTRELCSAGRQTVNFLALDGLATVALFTNKCLTLPLVSETTFYVYARGCGSKSGVCLPTQNSCPLEGAYDPDTQDLRWCSLCQTFFHLSCLGEEGLSRSALRTRVGVNQSHLRTVVDCTELSVGLLAQLPIARWHRGKGQPPLSPEHMVLSAIECVESGGSDVLWESWLAKHHHAVEQDNVSFGDATLERRLLRDKREWIDMAEDVIWNMVEADLPWYLCKGCGDQWI
ncbi:hypothetical protein CYLTODRAFT_486858 [Cylindrobasidium torrendii FP15055 ss-10]|uniref:Uncharacterized protein n=1 Tax=Cylindrobasidium torrendii FP15055 ss-10 TaxID=1314674 RepID=A0A0D7BQN3_9AGAR|nr:hypothetical protein CYLTODRAFT_486858 [Cylindrobasidium torrendii FP15055 ss-10]